MYKAPAQSQEMDIENKTKTKRKDMLCVVHIENTSKTL